MTLFHALGPFASSGGVVVAPGMVLVSPTSITHSGTSATLGANGQVTFSAVTSLSLNGCFSADFDNYVVSLRYIFSGGTGFMGFRLRAAGSDNSTASSYVNQRITADNTSVGALRSTIDKGRVTPSYSTQRSGATFTLYGPFLAQPTAVRDISASDGSSAYIFDNAFTHNQSVSYDGFTLFPDVAGPPNFTGALQVYGVRS